MSSVGVATRRKRGPAWSGRPHRRRFRIPTGWAFEMQDPWGNTIGFTDYSFQPALGRG
jgi:hypothetical protein